MNIEPVGFLPPAQEIVADRSADPAGRAGAMDFIGWMAREAGTVPAYESVHAAVAQALRQQSFTTALRQYLQLLAGQAELQGVDLEAADSPLVQ